jgi:CheY-like chemotaxis protein
MSKQTPNGAVLEHAQSLLADDEPINREIAQMLLEDVGLKIDLAETGIKQRQVRFR